MNTPPIPVAAPRLDEADIAAAVRVLESGHLVQGPEVAAFEDEFADLVDGHSCIAVNSGTSALWLTLLALGIGPGDEVIVPSFTFAATAAAVRLTGAVPVFADITPDTFCLDPDAVRAAITPRTAAVIPVHLFGHPAPMGEFTALAHAHHLALVEDAAQAHGATLNNRPAGTFGTAGCFSFYPTKNMQSIEGGMVVTANPALARTLRLLRNHGMERRYDHRIVGTNARMSDVNAAIARSQLRRLPALTGRRRANAARLSELLTGLPDLTLPTTAEGAGHVWHQYTVRIGDALGDRDTFAHHLRQAGTGTSVHYPVPLHRSPAYAAAADLPHTDTAAEQVLSLPVHPELTTPQIQDIAQAVTTLALSPARERAA
ncbi:DegT/DnrJ/EryC1/StrS family aminotransferase [Streptomyces sp. NBC_00826]|uniref:DegT/DnrJ/EryC1/StrS family aminotransferase n=1 Tax=Streptomyces sp. NBC_00826 TaxID=2975845 RepID=UPI002F90DA6B|nr:DegT/DnrJ/EryC1/StrS family aminotransferase [Streptomyces sp. NBC_00826]WTB60513.1 DegT/DnrJ/EryC1/StrS family aminotransferase [Streptomyces sp. NBC_00826]